jgi:hypothetical protein
MHVKITPLTSRRTIEREVEGGQLWVYYLPPDERARVEISVNGRGLSIGGKRKIRIEVGGGTAGLIFDARGRDLPVSQDLRTRATQMPLWLSQATGDAVTLIDESWLTETVKPNRRATTEVPAAPAKAAKPDKKSKKRDDKRKAEKPPRGKKQPAAPAKTDESDEMDELRDLFS